MASLELGTGLVPVIKVKEGVTYSLCHFYDYYKDPSSKFVGRGNEDITMITTILLKESN